MRSATVFASILALATSVFAQDATPGYAVISAPGNGEVVPSGKTFEIRWAAGKFSGPATISLLGGATPTTLQVLGAIASGVEVTKEGFSWPVNCDLGEDQTYGIKIADEASQGATFQFSFPFQIKGPSCGSVESTTTTIHISTSTRTSSTSSVSVTTTAKVAGYPTEKTTVTATPTPTGYPVEIISSSSSSSSISFSSYATNSTSTTVKSTSVKPTSYYLSTPAVSTLSTITTPVVTVTGVSVVTGSSSSPAATTTASKPIVTAGAGRVGAGLVLALVAAVFAL